MTRYPNRPDIAGDREWKRGLMLIAAITCVPVALVALARLLVG